MLDVVVLPCVPVTAIVGRSRGQLAEQVGAVQLALAALARDGALGVLGRDRGREDDLGAVRARSRRRGPTAGSMPAARSRAA